MNRLMLVVVLVLPVWLEGCGKPEASVSHETAQVNLGSRLSAVPVNTAPVQPAPTTTDTGQLAAALQAQAEQLMLMQLMQMQQQMVAQNINRLGQIGADASEQVYRQGVVNGCYLQGNCAVRTITVPAY